MRLNELGFYRKGPFGSSLTKDMFVPYSKSVIKVYEQKNAIQKDYRLGHYYISDTKFNQMQSFVTNPGDIIVSCAGTIGETYQLPDDAPIGIINQALMRVCLYDKSISEYWQMSFDYILLVNSEMKGAGSAIKNIPPFDVLKSLLVPIPPIAEQNRILSQYRILQSKIRAFETLNSDLERLNYTIFEKLKKSVLQEAIQGKLIPQDPNDEPASKLLERIKEEKAKLFKEGKLKKKDLVDSVIFKGEDNKYYEKVGSQVTCIDDDIPFEIPSSWSWVRLGNYTDVIGGYAFQSQDLKSENGCRVIRISDISEDGLVNTRIVRYSGNLELSQYRIYNSDILMAMTGGTVGKSLLLKSDNKEVLLLNQRVAIIRNTWFDVNYIDTVIKSAYIKSIIDNSKNSTNDNISMADITGFLIPIPPLNEQYRIIDKLEFVIASIMRR